MTSYLIDTFVPTWPAWLAFLLIFGWRVRRDSGSGPISEGLDELPILLWAFSKSYGLFSDWGSADCHIRECGLILGWQWIPDFALLGGMVSVTIWLRSREGLPRPMAFGVGSLLGVAATLLDLALVMWGW